MPISRASRNMPNTPRHGPTRLKDLGASDAMADIVHRGPDNVGREFSPEDRETLALDMDGEGGGGKPPVRRLRGAARRRRPVEARHEPGRPDEGTDWLGKTIEGFKRVYGELFDPTHPIRKLVDSVTKGEPLDDYSNPNCCSGSPRTPAPSPSGRSKREMVDLDGNATGHGLTDIVSGKSAGAKFSNADTKKFLDGYALAKWAVMMDEQGKKTGIDIDKAKAVVEDGKAKFETSFQHLVDWRNGTLKWLGDGGVHQRQGRQADQGERLDHPRLPADGRRLLSPCFERQARHLEPDQDGQGI
jgi:hypothetical protein